MSTEYFHSDLYETFKVSPEYSQRVPRVLPKSEITSSSIVEQEISQRNLPDIVSERGELSFNKSYID